MVGIVSATFIAEIKTKSPFMPVDQQPKHCFGELMEYAITYGDWISVHTNALWGGDFDSISFVRRNTTKPILAKGIHGTDDDIQRALDHGADYVLVVDRFPDFNRFDNRQILMEIHDIAKLKAKLNDDLYYFKNWVKIVCNSRNLRTGLPKKLWELDEYMKLGVWTCQASGIRTKADVHSDVDAFIVGERLVDFCKSL